MSRSRPQRHPHRSSRDGQPGLSGGSAAGVERAGDGLKPRRWIAAGVLAVVLTFAEYLLYEFVAVTSFQCDGHVPEWMIPDDCDGGCLELRPSWEARLPWNSGRTHPACLGMACMPSASPRATPWEMPR